MRRKKTFYHHLISTNDIEIELNKLGLADHERIELLEIAENTIHYTIIDIVLSELKEEDKKSFLEHHAIGNSETTLRFLKERIDDLETRVKESAEILKKNFLNDIAELTKR
jgi:hypothetical protein